MCPTAHRQYYNNCVDYNTRLFLYKLVGAWRCIILLLRNLAENGKMFYTFYPINFLLIFFIGCYHYRSQKIWQMDLDLGYNFRHCRYWRN